MLPPMAAYRIFRIASEGTGSSCRGLSVEKLSQLGNKEARTGKAAPEKRGAHRRRRKRGGERGSPAHRDRLPRCPATGPEVAGGRSSAGAGTCERVKDGGRRRCGAGGAGQSLWAETAERAGLAGAASGRGGAWRRAGPRAGARGRPTWGRNRDSGDARLPRAARRPRVFVGTSVRSPPTPLAQ